MFKGSSCQHVVMLQVLHIIFKFSVRGLEALISTMEAHGDLGHEMPKRVTVK